MQNILYAAANCMPETPPPHPSTWRIRTRDSSGGAARGRRPMEAHGKATGSLTSRCPPGGEDDAGAGLGVGQGVVVAQRDAKVTAHVRQAGRPQPPDLARQPQRTFE